MSEDTGKPMWELPRELMPKTRMHAFMQFVRGRHGVEFADYASLHRWSTSRREEFWCAVWDFCWVIGERGRCTVLDGMHMPGARWFPDARLNFARNLLRWRDEKEAIVFRSELETRRSLTHDELYREVARFAAALRSQGVKSGDRVAAYMPNMPETVIAMLAAASIGAIFSSASPDFGVQGVVDRFGQIEPVVLIAADGTMYNGKRVDVLERVEQIAARMPSLRAVVIVSFLYSTHELAAIPHAHEWHDFVAPFSSIEAIDFEELPFDHPLYVLYSSGTTGLPKCIVHGAGGTLLQHLKEHQLHSDINVGDRLFYFTTTGWMMWNWLVSALASGATIMLYEGSPFAGRRHTALWDYARDERFTHFGTSAKYLDSAAKHGLRPRETHRLDHLRCILSTGSPLTHEGFDYVYRDVKPDVCLSSISGGTDIVSCFVLGNPLLPVWRGEIQCKGLGMAVEVFGPDGFPLRAGKGELVCTKPFPSMPVGFWNDPERTRYHNAYFERFQGVWCHGDWCEETPHGGFVIHGRSDATLNPGGVRIGTAEIYRQVEKLPEVMESLVIGQEWEGDVRVVLFVRLREGDVLDDALIHRIRETIRENTSPRHVPARIVQVSDIPRTRSGKIVELAVRAVVHGESVKNAESLANPEVLKEFRDRDELRR